MENVQALGPKQISFECLKFMPRFDYGDQAQVAEVTGSDEGTVLGTGFVRLSNATVPWTIKYDEVLLVLEGSVTLETKAEKIVTGPNDCIWLPNGTELIYRSDSALVFYAIHPANWAEGLS